MSVLNVLMALGWPDREAAVAWGMQTHLLVAGVSLCLWLLLLRWIDRLPRVDAERETADEMESLQISRKILRFPRRAWRRGEGAAPGR
jgi:hypothetical protein